MQEIKKRRIVIASVLKPVDDPRMFGKLGRSLAKVADVHIVGFPSRDPAPTGLTFHPSRQFSRWSLSRIVQPWRVLRLLLKLHPTDIIVSTHELLLPAVICKLAGRCNLFYDLQENYVRNILYTPAFPFFIRPFLAAWVRLTERLLSPFVRNYLVAERAYLEEMPFIRNKGVVLENRFNAEPPFDQPVMHHKNGKTLIFSGTLARSTGVFTAIELARILNKADPSVRLTIVGYCPKKDEFTELLAEIRAHPFIVLHGGDSLVPHDEVIQRIRESDFGLIAYSVSPATRNRVPTKIFEYLALGLGLATVPHPPWVDFIRQYREPVTFNPAAIDTSAILQAMTALSQTPGKFDPGGLFWSEVEPQLLELFRPSASYRPIKK